MVSVIASIVPSQFAVILCDTTTYNSNEQWVHTECLSHWPIQFEPSFWLPLWEKAISAKIKQQLKTVCKPLQSVPLVRLHPSGEHGFFQTITTLHFLFFPIFSHFGL